MSITFTAPRLLAVALFAIATSFGADQAAGAADAKAAAAAAAKEKARKGATSTADLKKLVEEAGRQRDTMIADYEAMAKQLRDATEEQKKTIKEKMEAQKKAFEEVMNALHTQIRDEQRRQRQNAAPGKR